MDSQFLETVFHSPPVLLGRALKPFCCGHAVTLDALESPFVKGGTATLDDLISAIWVCSHSFEEIRSKFGGDRQAMLSECVDWGKSASDFDLQSVNEGFQRYLVEGTRAPQRWKTKESKNSRAPWALTVVTALMREMKMSEAQAWNMPLPQALWYFASISEANGDKSLKTEEDRERQKIAAEMNVQEVVANG